MASKYDRIGLEELTRITRRPSDFGWHDAPKDSHLWAFTRFAQNRDSGPLERVNYEVAVKELFSRRAGRGSVLDSRFGHFAVGWVDQLIVRVCRKLPRSGETVPTTLAWQVYCELRDRVDNYPCLDEDKLSEVETTEALEYLENEVPPVEMFKTETRDQLILKVYSWLGTHGHVIEDNHAPSSVKIKEALFACGCVVDPVHEDWKQYDPAADGACMMCAKPRLPHPERKQFSITGELLPVIENWRSEFLEIYKGCKVDTWWCPEHRDLVDEYYD